MPPGRMYINEIIIHHAQDDAFLTNRFFILPSTQNIRLC